MIVLGIHCGHDSSAAIVADGRVLADVAEERFTRLKHCNHVPVNAIGACLRAAGLQNINDADYIAVAGIRTPAKLAVALGLPAQSGLRDFAKRALHLAAGAMGQKVAAPSRIRTPVYYPNIRLLDPRKLVNIEHHRAHASSAYYTRSSPDDCLVFTIDGAGDGVSTAVWEGRGGHLHPLQRLHREAAIGWAYSVVTEGLHFWHGDGEGTTMGLAPYGESSGCVGVLDRYFPTFAGTEVGTPSRLGLAYYWHESGSTQFHFEEAREVERLVAEHGAENIAAEVQRKLEETVQAYVFSWVRKMGCNRTAFAGGVFLNVKLNQRIWNNRGADIQEQHIYPNPGDAGLAVGAALHVYHQHHEFAGRAFPDLYLGPSYSDAEIETILRDRGLPVVRLEDPSATAAVLLAENRIIGWFQDRMESGPRALGNRSILMSPTRAENKDVINARVKYREAFRPFCPSILYERRHDYLKDARDEFFMITSFDVTDRKRAAIPAVVHVDGTVRPQMVRHETNPRFWRLIDEFGRLTGEYAVLNTSFNIKGEPIISSPREAIRCFFDSGIDALILGSFLITKPATQPGTGPT